jgi:hypothetical protein
MRQAMIVLLGSVALAMGCQARDGEACEKDDDCASGYCGGGYCLGSSCQRTSQCERGWSCEQPPEWLELFTFGLASGVCYQPCSECPAGERYYCDGELCKYDGSPWVEIVGPVEIEVGVEATFTGEAEAADDRAIVAWLWSSSREGDLGEAPSLTRAFDQADEFVLRLEVEDESGLSAEASTTVTVCLPPGSPCEPGDPCCGVEICESQLDGSYLCEPEAVCGDSVRSGSEECDGDDLGNQSCETAGNFSGGSLACDGSCHFEFSGCTP